MTEKIEWSREMSDEEFALVAEPYFKRKYITLHEGVCLVACVDPNSRGTPVGEGYENWTEDNDPVPFDYTRRPFEVALRAINGEEPGLELKTHKRPDYIQNGRQVLVNSRTFFRWVVDMWPDNTTQIQFAEKLRVQRKKARPSGYLSSKSKTESKHERQRNAFFRMIAGKAMNWKKYSTHELAQMLEAKLKGTPDCATARTLTKRIKECLPRLS